MAMSSPHITYTPRTDATPEVEISALANVYRFVLDRANKNAAGVSSTNGDDAMKGSLEHEVRAKSSIHE
jgi:hypothetical protein